MTPNEIIRLALLNSGISVSQTIYAEEVYRAFDLLNLMIGQWNRKRWLLYCLNDIACTATGATSYTVGPGMDFDTPRPDRIEGAYVRLLPVNNNQPFDTPLSLIQSREDYSLIVLKNLETWPSAVFYESTFPTGNLFPYPVPNSGQYEVHILVKNVITQFNTINDDLDLPPEYSDALMWNLVTRLASAYGRQPDVTAVGYAKAGLITLRQANMQIPTLKMPFGYPRSGLYGYGWVLGTTGGFN